MSASATPPRPASKGQARPNEAAAWDWLQTQLKGRPVPALLTLIGLGDLSILTALDTRSPGTKVLALEPDVELARTTLTSERVGEWRRSGRLVYLTGPDYAGADQAWRIFSTRFEQPPLVVHPGSAAAPGVRNAVAVLAKIVFGAKSNSDARRRFAPRYLLNSIRNLPSIVAGGDVRALAGRAPAVPAVVVGAGPSLDASLDALHRLHRRAVIVATDTALRPLLARGIRPELVVALDPSELNGRHLLGLPACPDTWLVAESALDPRAVSMFAGRTLWFRVAPHQPWPWLNAIGVDVGRLEVWGSVLTAAYQVARLAGCDPIIMAGADLSFPEGRPYVRGTTYEFDWAWAAAFGSPVEETWRTQLASRRDLRVEKDIAGTATPTTGVMLEFRDWLVAQARTSGRRVVNVAGRGLLFGEGVEQADLDSILAGAPPVALSIDASSPNAARTALVESSLCAALSCAAAGRFDQPPLPDWQDFSGDGFDPGALQAAIETAVNSFDRSVDAPRCASVPDAPTDHALERLPEAVTLLRRALRGESGANSLSSPSESVRTLGIALHVLRGIVETVGHRPDFAGFPDPDRLDDTPAGATAMWPEDIRQTVLRFEGILGGAWGRAATAPHRRGIETVAVLPDDLVGATTSASPRPYAMHACLLLVIEWLRCAASVTPALDASLSGLVDRLWRLEHTLRTKEEWERPARALELVIDWSGTGSAARLILPLRVSVEAWWALRAGLLRDTDADDLAWLVALSADGGLIRAWLRPSGAALPGAPADGRVHTVPVRRLEFPEWPRVKIADQIPSGALGVVPGGSVTVHVDAAGRARRYQTWPRPITGALSLRGRGEVAWNGSLGTRPDGPKPYLMWRSSPEARVDLVELPFRPARGVLWRGRVYMNCLPTGPSEGGVGSWAPGEAPILRWPHLALQGLLIGEDGLRLEPYFPGEHRNVGRLRAAGAGAWTWMPGAPSIRRTLGSLGAASASVSNGRWTATAYPQADTILLTSANGRSRRLECYFPTRLAWAGESLIVYAADPDLLLFEGLAPLLDEELR